MTSIFDCIQRAVDAGELGQEAGSQTQYYLAELTDRYAATMPMDAAEAMAAKDLAEAARKGARTRLHAAVAQMQAKRRLAEIVETADDPATALTSMLEMAEGSGYTGDSVVSMERSLIRTSMANISAVLREASLNLLGQSRKPALLRDIVRELHGQPTGDGQARTMAQAVSAERERLRRMFNAHGGDIGQIENYGLPHSHDARKLRELGFNAWRDEIFDKLDWHRIIDKTTEKRFAATPDGRPNRAAADAFLRRIFDNIASEGANTFEPSMGGARGKALYNQRAESRELHFKDGDAWWDYNARFGRQQPFDAMVGSLQGFARDIALMRVLGPNPKAGLEFAAQVAERRVKLERLRAVQAGGAALKAADKRVQRITSRAGRARNMLAMMDGSANVPVSEGWANFFSGTRAVLTSIQLGGALLSSTTDVVTLRMASKAIGMNPSNMVSRAVKMMVSGQTKENAARLGYIADTLSNTGAAAARLTAETITPDVAQRLAEFTLRASGLNWWTDRLRMSFQMEFNGYLALNADRPLADVDAPLRKLLTERGITADDWDALRAPEALFTTDTGETFMNPMHFRNAGTLDPEAADQLATRLQGIIEEELEKAVPTGSVEMRAIIQQGTQPGTFLGELARNGMAYKSFVLSLTMMQYRRIMAISGPRNRAMYAAQLLAGMTLMGALAVQLKETAKGRDPRPMDTGAFWGAAVAQGGGLGIFGDFFFSTENRVGGGIASTILGPVAGLANDVGQLTAGNAIRAAQGDTVNLGRDVARFQERYTPVMSSLWYARLAFDRLVSDQLQAVLDPEADAYWRRIERRMAREYGTESWWQNAAPLPDRAPDLSNALGDMP